MRLGQYVSCFLSLHSENRTSSVATILVLRKAPRYYVLRGHSHVTDRPELQRLRLTSEAQYLSCGFTFPGRVHELDPTRPHQSPFGGRSQTPNGTNLRRDASRSRGYSVGRTMIEARCWKGSVDVLHSQRPGCTDISIQPPNTLYVRSSFQNPRFQDE